MLCAGAALLLLSPFTPMLFMGEEWGARTPWQFFSDHAADLGRAVSEGRRREFAAHGWNTEQIPDPQDPATFAGVEAGLERVPNRPGPPAAATGISSSSPCVAPSPR